MACCFHSRDTRATPNDPKLSDGRLGRDACAAGGKAAAEAGGVTEPPVRCSAWLGVAVVEGEACMDALIEMTGGQQECFAVAGLPPQGRQHHPVLEL